MARLRSYLLLATTVSGVALATGCGSGSSDSDIDNGFESDDPTGRSAEERNASAGSAAPEDASESGGAERAVQEADIIKVDGNRLYALSKFGGLAIVDITNPDQLRLLGRKRIDGMPFEMYVENGRAFVMLNEFGRWVRSADSYGGSWVQSSEILALDVTNPAAISELSHFDVPGSIADSRLVGDIAYVVTYENGYCWNCQTNPATIVTSFRMGSAITKSDQLIYSAQNRDSASWQRSVSATNQRLYIAGPEWNWRPGTTNASSLIQVVDITDPTGKLTKGADVPVAGQINSRWQMDESAGVLRVVSQFGNGWGGGGQINPKVQTFTVTSSTQITPLGSTDLVLPKPEQLRSVRFDGPRGYAITAERTDPLFTIDLSNPAAPKQAGQLEMPGWIFHMEPRGDRLIGFGYDNTAPSQANLAVSLFDVSDLAKPTMLKRVSFGAGWSQLPEDQDRIHKAVRVLDDQGLILVPFASYGRWSSDKCESPQSGIQLIDFNRQDLGLRGIAPQWGMPRRAFVANGRLLAMSDRNVTSFDITSRDAPAKKFELDLSNPAYRLAELPGHIASISNDWWSGEVLLSLTPKEAADDADVTSKLSLASLAPPSSTYCNGKGGWTSWYEARLFTNGTTLYVTVPVYSYDSNVRGGKLIAAAIDVSNPAKPTILGKVESPFINRDASNGGYYWGGAFADGWSYYSYYGGAQGSLVGSGQAIVQRDAKLAYIENDYEPYRTTRPDGSVRWNSKIHRRVHVLDFSLAAQPTANVVALGDSLGSAPLHLFKNAILTSRWVPSTKSADKVRFFVDRIDIGAATPVLLPSVNTPGSLVLADEASSRFVTTDYQATRISVPESVGYNGYQFCREQLGSRAWFDYDGKQCIRVTRDFKLSDVSDTKVTLRQTMSPPSQNIAGVQIADDRIYVSHYRQYDYSQPATSPGQQPKILEQGGLWAIGGVRGGELKIVSELVGDAEWPLAAHGTKVALYTQGGLAIYDTGTPQPTLVSEANLRGWGYSSHVLMSDRRAIASLGEWGLQTLQY